MAAHSEEDKQPAAAHHGIAYVAAIDGGLQVGVKMNIHPNGMHVIFVNERSSELVLVTTPMFRVSRCLWRITIKRSTFQGRIHLVKTVSSSNICVAK